MPQSIFSILAEVNCAMDSLTKELDSTLSFIEARSAKRDEQDIKVLMDRITQVTKDDFDLPKFICEGLDLNLNKTKHSFCSIITVE